MKRYHALFVVMLSAIATFGCGGCAHNQESVTTTKANSSGTTYDSQDLARTGKRTSGEALQAADPSVTATTGR
jgi:hypothetical protein